MKRILISTMVICLAFGGLLERFAEAGTSCHLINAKGVGKDLGVSADPDGTLHILTSATVIGGGLLHGMVTGSLTLPPPAGPVAQFTEIVTFTTQHGTLTVNLTGWVDFASSHFHASGPVTGGTGKLAGATGTLSLSGDDAAGTFTEDINGAVCVNLAP